MSHKVFYFFIFFFFGSVLSYAFSYDVQFKGSPDKAIIKEIRSVSQLIENKKKSPSSLTALRRRADSDIPRIMTVLHNHGYYSSNIHYQIETLKNRRVKVIMTIIPGPLFFLRECTINNCPADIDKTWFDIELGKTITAREILQLRNEILEKLIENGYPFAKVSTPKVRVSLSKRSIYLTITIQSGPKYSFGKTTIKGLINVKKDYVQQKIRWKEGDIFNEKLLKITQNYLEKCGLFNIVDVSYEKDPSTDSNKLPTTIELKESKHRSLGLSLGYTTHKGIGTQADWQHRNMRNMGDLLSFNFAFADRERSLRLLYRIYDFCRPNQRLTMVLEEGRETTKAYKTYLQKIQAYIDRKISKNVFISAGVQFENLQTSFSDNNGSFLVFSIPLSVTLDKTNRIFHPTVGYYLQYKVSPHLDLKYSSLLFLKQRATFTYYHNFIKEYDVTGLAWVTAGSIIGASRQKIPPPNRFYGGSENTLRGYKHYTVCPLSNNKPIGGCSLFVYGLELRTAVNKNITTGPFFEQGNVFASSFPHLNKKLLRSCGWQVRFATPIGSLSASIALPIDRRSIDNAFQIYVTMGKAF